MQADQAGLEIHREIRRLTSTIAIICVTPDTRAHAVIEAVKQGAYDCLSQPLDLAVLRRVVFGALDVARQSRQPPAIEATLADCDADGDIVGSCPAMGEVYKAIGRVAGQDVPVLITGESGTGKELIARAMHNHSPRSKTPFLALPDCRLCRVAVRNGRFELLWPVPPGAAP
jgi:two-component system nitrogen regulation response regulator GlnG